MLISGRLQYSCEVFCALYMRFIEMLR